MSVICIALFLFPNAILYAQDIEAKLSGNTAAKGFTIKNNAGNPLLTIRADGNVGIGLLDPDAALHIFGQVKITGGTPGLGRVLTSDADGLASWAAPVIATGNTLGQSYNQGGGGAGRTITADAGAVTVAGVDGLIVTGAMASGSSLPVNGAGTRMFFYPRLGAFRTGTVSGPQWDQANLGNYTFASGFNPTAGGEAAVAMGISASATGKASLACGEGVSASGSQSVSTGIGSTASGSASTSMGYHSEASGSISTAMGEWTWASGSASTTMGSLSIASGMAATAMGYNSDATGSISTAMGNGSIASGDKSTAMGAYTIAGSYVSTAIGQHNVGGGTATSWVATDPLFEIGNGLTPMARSNALTVLKNGNVGIGTTTPFYLLECTGSAGKTGGGSWSNSSDIRLKNVDGPYTKGLAEISRLRSIRFHYKPDNPRRLPSENEEIGFVAQEARQVFPECVMEGKDGYLDFNMHAINVALVNAVKELKTEKDAEIAALREELSSLRTEIKAMKAEIAGRSTPDDRTHADLQSR
jgi:hypothetical protein